MVHLVMVDDSDLGEAPDPGELPHQGLPDVEVAYGQECDGWLDLGEGVLQIVVVGQVDLAALEPHEEGPTCEAVGVVAVDDGVAGHRALSSSKYMVRIH